MLRLLSINGLIFSGYFENRTMNIHQFVLVNDTKKSFKYTIWYILVIFGTVQNCPTLVKFIKLLLISIIYS